METRLAQEELAHEKRSRNGKHTLPDEDAVHETDLGNAKRLVQLHGEDVRYCHPWRKWLVWDGVRWRRDDTGAIDARAKDVVKSILRDAQLCDDKTMRARLAAWAIQSESRQRIAASISLAASESGIPVRPNELDRDPWLLNARTATIDLRSMAWREHRREDLITKLVDIDFDPGASCPTFLRFLDEIMLGREELVDYLRRAFGYAVTGSTREQVLFVLYGAGANGKSTLLEAIRSTVGDDYSAEAAPNLLMARNGESHPTERAQLHGKRIVTAIEVEEGRRLNEAWVKQISGSDTITARRMREDFWSFTPTHTVFLAANHRPVIRGTDYAIWRRIRLIPFEARFERGRNADPDLPAKLAQERPGILAWLIAGALEWYQAGLRDPAEVLAATEDYRQDMDTVADFVAERCVTGDPGYTARGSELYDAYLEWLREAGGEALDRRVFGRRLAERGFEGFKGTAGRRMWRGIGLEVSK